LKKKGFTQFPTTFGVKFSLHLFFNKKILTIFSLNIFPTIFGVKFSLHFFFSKKILTIFSLKIYPTIFGVKFSLYFFFKFFPFYLWCLLFGTTWKGEVGALPALPS